LITLDYVVYDKDFKDGIHNTRGGDVKER
jgi:hypothetical protein